MRNRLPLGARLKRSFHKALADPMRLIRPKKPVYPPTHGSFVVVPTPLAQPLDLRPGAVAVFLHAYYVDEVEALQAWLVQAPFPFDLHVSTDTQEKADRLACFLKPLYGERLFIGVFPNRGRDIAAKFVGFRGSHAGYDYVAHVHTKKSLHDDDLREWRDFTLKCLFGSAEIVKSIIGLFEQNEDLGIVAPRVFPNARPGMKLLDNVEASVRLAERLGAPLTGESLLDFPAGSMFWARPAALEPLFDLHLRFEDFEAEAGQKDGTLAHALERMIFLGGERAGYFWLRVGGRDRLASFERPIKPKDLRDLKRRFRSALTPR